MENIQVDSPYAAHVQKSQMQPGCKYKEETLQDIHGNVGDPILTLAGNYSVRRERRPQWGMLGKLVSMAKASPANGGRCLQYHTG